MSTAIPEIKLVSPVFIFFSERTFNRKLRMQASQIAEQTYFATYRNVYKAAMGETTDLFQFGVQHFLRIFLKAQKVAGETAGLTTHDLMQKEPEVKSLNKYLAQLGYEWTLGSDEDVVNFGFFLRKDDQWISVEKFSSGEKEIVHFLLAMFALNVQDGLILIDEPELHLHPRWQMIFLTLFKDLAIERDNQFIIATHSPVFVTPDTINDVTRIYRSDTGSRRVTLRAVTLPEKKNLVRMINSQNNERIFFADKVVLVEGITDRLIVTSLINAAAERFSNNQAVEVIEVGGKKNFEQYQSMLSALETPTYVVADRDYLFDI